MNRTEPRNNPLKPLLGLKKSLEHQLLALRSADLGEIIKCNKTCSGLVSELAELLKGADAGEFASRNRAELAEVRKLLNLNQALLTSLVKTTSSFQEALLTGIAANRPECSGVFVSEVR